MTKIKALYGKLSVHTKTQVARFVRVFGITFVTSITLTGGAMTKDVVIAAAIAAAETAWRQFRKATPDEVVPPAG